MKFFGTYNHNLDSKGRLVVPARFRESLKELKTLYLLQGFEGSISVYPEEAYQKEVAYLDTLNFKDAQARAYVRTMYGSIEELEVDAAGRITLSVRILKKYNLPNNVTVVGVGDHLEIWDAEAYERYEGNARLNLEDIAQNLRDNND